VLRHGHEAQAFRLFPCGLPQTLARSSGQQEQTSKALLKPSASASWSLKPSKALGPSQSLDKVDDLVLLPASAIRSMPYDHRPVPGPDNEVRESGIIVSTI
jgi:hypothetical protein